jgi:hypothetical protein
MEMTSEELRIPDRDDRQTIKCIYCLKAQQVSRKAMRLTCKFCSKALRIEEMPIKDYQARRTIETCGMVTVEKKGHVVSERILCGSLIVRGKVKGTVVSHGVVLVGPDAEIKGDVTAPRLGGRWGDSGGAVSDWGGGGIGG